MRRHFSIILLVCLVGFGIANAFSQVAVRSARSNLLHTFRSPRSQLPEEALIMLAGEFKGLVADYLLLEVGSFIGSNQDGSPEDWHNVYLALKKSMALDPNFQQTYLYAQGTLPWEAKMPEKAIELLEISRQNRPWDWIPGQYMGFDYFYFLKDYAKASEVFLETARIKNSPPIIADLGARFAHKTRQTEAAIALLSGIIMDEGLDAYKKGEIQNRVAALEGVLLLERAISRYQAQYHNNPASLESLIDCGLLPKMPFNPYADTFFYDPQTGSVAFDRVK